MTPSRLTRPAAGLLLDVVLVVVFAAIGRASHAEGDTVLGVLGTAWPFLVGTVAGWVVVRLLRRGWPLDVGAGVTVWFAALVVGMALRRAVGEGTAWPFVVVASVTLAVLLLGWRAVARWRRGRSAGRNAGHAGVARADSSQTGAVRADPDPARAQPPRGAG